MIWSNAANLIRFIYAGVNEKKAFRIAFDSNFVQETLKCVDNLRKMMKHKKKSSFIT